MRPKEQTKRTVQRSKKAERFNGQNYKRALAYLDPSHEDKDQQNDQYHADQSRRSVAPTT